MSKTLTLTMADADHTALTSYVALMQVPQTFLITLSALPATALDLIVAVNTELLKRANKAFPTSTAITDMAAAAAAATTADTSMQPTITGTSLL